MSLLKPLNETYFTALGAASVWFEHMPTGYNFYILPAGAKPRKNGYGEMVYDKCVIVGNNTGNCCGVDEMTVQNLWVGNMPWTKYTPEQKRALVAFYIEKSWNCGEDDEPNDSRFIWTAILVGHDAENDDDDDLFAGDLDADLQRKYAEVAEILVEFGFQALTEPYRNDNTGNLLQVYGATYP